MGLTGAFLDWDCDTVVPLSLTESWWRCTDGEGASLRDLIPFVGIGLFGRGGCRFIFAPEDKSDCGLGWFWLDDGGTMEGK